MKPMMKTLMSGKTAAAVVRIGNNTANEDNPKFSNKALLTGVTAGLIFAASLVQAGEFAIKPNKVKWGPERYFRLNAQEMELGSYGSKISKVGSKHGLDKVGNLNRALLKGNWKKSEPVTITDVKKTDLSINGSLQDPARIIGVSGDDFYKLVKEGKCRFRKVYVNDLNKLAQAITDDKSSFTKLKETKRPRVITSMLIADTCQLREQSQLTHNGAFKGIIEGLKITVNPSLSSETGEVVKFHGIVGYRTHKPKFDKRPKKASKIVSWKPDQKGIK